MAAFRSEPIGLFAVPAGTLKAVRVLRAIRINGLCVYFLVFYFNKYKLFEIKFLFKAFFEIFNP